jgi:hypothetical protein
VGPPGVAEPAPAFDDDDLGFPKRVEDLAVQKFISEPGVEASLGRTISGTMDGTAVAGGTHLTIERVRPDIIHVRPADGTPRRIINADGQLEVLPSAIVG